MKRIFNYGIVVEDFQPITNGIKDVIINSLFSCDVVLLYVISSPINTIPYQLTKRMLEDMFKSNLLTKSLMIREVKIPKELYIDKKLTNDGKEFLRNAIKSDFIKEFSVEPSLYVHEFQSLSDRWIKSETFSNCAELSLPKSKISGQYVINCIAEDNKSEFEKHAPIEIHKYYQSIRDTVIRKLNIQ